MNLIEALEKATQGYSIYNDFNFYKNSDLNVKKIGCCSYSFNSLKDIKKERKLEWGVCK